MRLLLHNEQTQKRSVFSVNYSGPTPHTASLFTDSTLNKDRTITIHGKFSHHLSQHLIEKCVIVYSSVERTV